MRLPHALLPAVAALVAAVPATAGQGPAARAARAARAPAPAPRCRTAELAVALVRSPGGGAAGSVYQELAFTNRGRGTCALIGHPGVSFVAGGDGHRVGAAARRVAPPRPARVVLARRARAIATLRIARTADFPPSDCRPRRVRGLRVYPPGATAAAFVRRPGTACSSRADAQLSVTAVRAGRPPG
ncbi:DUF4232 domain-containing protein [Baekduia soli]|nr:DUF4232 domain-containing protein [Baekduia soli]